MNHEKSKRILAEVIQKEEKRMQNVYKTPRNAIMEYCDGEISYGKFVEICKNNWPSYAFDYGSLQVVRQLAELCDDK